jgi:predicted DNA-binding transcriptional regulator AlpA
VTTLPPDLISVPEAAKRIGRSADSIYSLCRKGDFPPAVRIGGKWVVSVPRLERWLHGESTTEVVA